ncbi:SPOR domain-containing protein [Paracoccus sp. ME4]|uniref:SPOR domain-containing protein n=1 Tax=Paracoccus sp. ME4 TaxID=3138066 RepID=UPI00398A9F03
MNARVQVLALVMLAGAAGAAPVPPPPEGFAGTQYIDGQGCVFTRDGAGWAPRLDGAGQGLCGFPPSLAARRTDALTERVLPLTPPPAPDVETMLMEQLSRDLRQGEWAADPAQPEERREAETPRVPDPMQTALRDALELAPALRNASGLSGSPELCARLGYRVQEGAAQGSTLGLCPGMQSDPAAASVRPGGATATPPPAPARTRVAARPEVRDVPRTQPEADRRRPAPAAAPAEPGPEMIPASARYVQVGRFADEENARIVLRALAARGYPTGQARVREGDATVRLVMAGPFADRQALVAALNDLRRNGYPKARAR